MTPPKPVPRPDKVSLWRYVRLFRRDILSAQPARLYRAWMAEFRTPFFRSYLVNQPDLVRQVLNQRPEDFPKSDRIGEGLRPLLGNAVFLTNGDTWARQRRIIDPAFEKGRLRDTFPSILAAGQTSVDRLRSGPGVIDIEPEASHAAADVIFRTLFSVPIDDHAAAQVFREFRIYQQSQPILNLAAFIPLPRWMPRMRRGDTRNSARAIRQLIREMTQRRMADIQAGLAPDDLATKIMTTPDPQTDQCFQPDEMADQVAIFFLAGHETSAAALGWALYLLASHPDIQARAAIEAADFASAPTFANLSRLRLIRDVFRESLRLYPPVPMMVRETTRPEQFRDRQIAKGAQIVISPWHVHRHERLWDEPDAFDPDRFDTKAGRASMRDAYMPFSSGKRVCPGAGMAMVEGPVLLALILADFVLEPVVNRTPIPVAYLTVRSKNGIWLELKRRR